MSNDYIHPTDRELETKLKRLSSIVSRLTDDHNWMTAEARRELLREELRLQHEITILFEQREEQDAKGQ